ncbi:MAG: hypothetical protein KJ661_05445 [Candidatus Omnitrophica bacterium]|nr:hypothetical protein [Candidatus Omnitrophota bacterium]
MLVIVPMKKIAIIVQSEESGRALQRLRSLGALHLEHQSPPSGKNIDSIKDDIASLDKVVNILSSPELAGKSGVRGVRFLKDWRFTAQHILATVARVDHLTEYSRSLIAQVAAWENWGDFDPGALLSLSDKGVNIKLCRIPVKELPDMSEKIIVKKIIVSKETAYCALISREKIALPYKDEGLPKMSLTEMRARLTENDDITRMLKETLRKYTCYLDRYLEIRKAFRKELEFHEALRGMGDAGRLAYVVGYAPRDRVAALKERAKSERWGISITDPSPEDEVPTLLRNPAWIAMINPVFKLLNMVPGYKELDISFWFLIFFSVFFGMLIGDAGIGMIFIILTIFAQARFGKGGKNRSVYYLFYVLSLCAIIWGLLTGTIFGQEWLNAWYKPLVPALRDNRNIQALCFLIGGVHLSIAHIWRAVRKAPSVACLADIGWVLILWGGFFLAMMLVLGESFPAFGSWLFGAGAILVMLFTAPSKNILKSIGAGAGALAANLVNSFTDIVSYIRLFAVGLATIAVADAFNSMAMDVGFGNLFSGIIAALILVVGQALNVVLGPMSVLVHGVRLNVLEFSSHMDIKWSGFKYNPLKEEQG